MERERDNHIDIELDINVDVHGCTYRSGDRYTNPYNFGCTYRYISMYIYITYIYI